MLPKFVHYLVNSRAFSLQFTSMCTVIYSCERLFSMHMHNKWQKCYFTCALTKNVKTIALYTLYYSLFLNYSWVETNGAISCTFMQCRKSKTSSG